MKRKYVIGGIVAALVAVMGSPVWADMFYTDHVVVDQSLKAWWLNPADVAYWDHVNPFNAVGDYDAALGAGEITGVTLTVNASGIVAGGETNTVGIRFQDKNDFWHDLGLLNDGDTTFNLDPFWLDGVTVRAKLVYNCSSWFDLWDSARINCSDLTVRAVPVPGAALLGALGLSAAGIKLRRRRS